MQHCLLHAPCHTYWKGYSMPLSDLAREIPSHLRRSFVTLKWILLGEFHTFIYHVSKAWLVCNIERSAVFIKERGYHSIHIWILTSTILSMIYIYIYIYMYIYIYILPFVTVKYCQTRCASATLFRLLKISIVEFFWFTAQASDGWKSNQISKKRKILLDFVFDIWFAISGL